MKNKPIVNRLRKASKNQLLALDVIAKSPTSLATTSQMQDVLYSQISDSSGTAVQSVGGTISSIARIKSEGEPLLIPMGRDVNSGVRWKLNEKVIDQPKLRKITSEILSSWDQ